MEKINKKQAILLGVRIGIVFFITVIIMILAAYFILSQNVHNLLTENTIKLVQAMTEQGVEMVENELESGRKEVEALAKSFSVPKNDGQSVVFPQLFNENDFTRIIYISDRECLTSDGRKRDIREREDIVTAMQGKVSIYGPYFNEENEFVVCYSAPIIKNGQINGVLSIEKDGYKFSEVIKNIKFGKSGESYIINEDGTDIAVSDKSHMDWVTSEYNARKLLEKDLNEETLSVLELEQKGLQGEIGVGTYYWHDGLCYVFYHPISSVGWVLLAGLREEEIVAMTNTALFTAVSKGPMLGICLVLIFILTGLIIFWIISNMKKNAEINEKLMFIANHDSLTGLLNRRFLENSLAELWEYPVKMPTSAAIFMLDIDNFKQYNDYFGHPKGDDCLRQISSIFKHIFDGYNCNVMRYGGEEFIAVVFLIDRMCTEKLASKICRSVENEKIPDSYNGVVTVSVGACYVNSTLEDVFYNCIKIADKALYEAKNTGKNRAVVYDSNIEETENVLNTV